MRQPSRWIHIGYWLIVKLVIQPTQAQQVWINAHLIDNQTNGKVAASWQWMDSTGLTLTRTLTTAISFSGFIPIRAQVLRVDAPGYRAVRIPIRWHTSVTDSSRFLLTLPAVAVDKPAGNQPYFQSEQQAFRLEQQAPGTRTVSATVLVVDALTSQPVAADVCLFFTQGRQKTCFLPDKKPVVRLSQPDIIALEINAPGYQPYLGNLVVDSLPTQAVFYQVRLAPMPTLLLIAASPSNTSVTLSAIGNSISSDTFTTMPVCITANSGLYAVSFQHQTGQIITDTITIEAGINAYTFPLKTRLETFLKETISDLVFFDQSSYELTAEARSQLQLMVEKLRRQPQQKVIIVGHTDSVGSQALNLTLSEFRAKVVQAFLIRQGISPSRIQTEAAGQRKPAYPNDSEVNRSRNRRVELILK